MGRHQACTIACSLLLLSVCSAQSIAADEPAATSVTETLTATATTHEQSRFVAFADTILPDAVRTPRVASDPLFAQPGWLMPLPDISARKEPIEHKSASASPHTKNVALAEPIDSAPDKSIQSTIAQEDSEPFGIQAVRAPRGLLWTKWRKVQHAIETEAPALTRCRTATSRCSRAAARFVAIVEKAARRHGRARLELVNQRINYAIRYVSDRAQWHRADVWSAPFNRHHDGAFQTGKGDCEDYAIAKYVALRDAGTPLRDLRLLVVRDKSVHSYHAVLAARLNGRWLLLDNRWRRLIPDNEAQFFKPLFALNAAGVERFTTARAKIHRATIKRTAAVKGAAKAPGRIILAGELGATPGSA